ncbi:myosin-3-like [Cocos nucifera]|nr:myosin-3-like [Cocos nucifera]
MAASKLLMVSIVLWLLIVGIRGDAEVEDGTVAKAWDSPLKLETEQLKSKVAGLESSISDRTDEVKRKDERISQLEKIVEEKSATMASLQSEVELLQKKGVVDVQELVGKADARADELEKQIEKLKNEIEAQTGKGDAYEARAGEAEKKVQELSLKLENEELAMMQLEARSKSDQLREDLAVTHWNENGKPALDVFLQKASEKSTQAQKWVEPHMETARTEQWVTLITYIGPHVQMVSAKAIEAYRLCTNTVTLHVVRVKELADPYFQEAKKFSKPYVNQVAAVSKPHVEKVRLVMKPYTKYVAHAYGKSLESATAYHHQVQAAVQEKLEKHELTKPLATKELVWFMLTAFSFPFIPFLFESFERFSHFIFRFSFIAKGNFMHFCIKLSPMFFSDKVQAAVQEKLEKHELTKPLATKELVWFMVRIAPFSSAVT